MTEEQDDLRHAAFYLSLDMDEMQNVIAEHRKADARRKTAVHYWPDCPGGCGRASGSDGTGLPCTPPSLCGSCWSNNAKRRAYHERREAMIHGDATASAPEPVAFAAIQCTNCDATLTTQTHGRDRLCQGCFDQANALAWQNAHRAANHERKLRKAVNGAWEVFAWIVVALCAAAVAGWAAGALAWQIGYRL